MKIEFPALQSDPLIYFLVHSGFFVLVLGALFFSLGLWFGASIWGRYKVLTKVLREENEAQRSEVATLKRKLAEQSMRPLTGPLPPMTHLLTEVLPSVGDVFPERPPFEYPALAALPLPQEQVKPTVLTAIIKGSATAPLTLLPEVDPALGLLYRQAPPDADDLTKIKGIASVLEKRLHELGIHTYRQIASWDDRHVREFSSRLAFKDRITREHWVEQARALNEARQSA